MAGRPREFDRDAALSKARDVFWARGFEGVSMADLVGTLGIASARIYAAFGSKEALFREAVALYDEGEGGFATRALAEEDSARKAFERIFTEAVATYTQAGRPRGCMVVSAATNCSDENAALKDWLAELRRGRTSSLIERVRQGVAEGELDAATDPLAIGDYLAAALHGLSVQARDGISRKRLLATIPLTLKSLPWKGGWRS